MIAVRLVDASTIRVRLGPHERLTGAGPIVLGLRRDPLVFALDGAGGTPEGGTLDA